MSQPSLPHTGPSLKELRINTGVFIIIIKSMSARLITNMLEGVRRLLVLWWVGWRARGQKAERRGGRRKGGGKEEEQCGKRELRRRMRSIGGGSIVKAKEKGS